jgi:HPt (histidine-containing phosphotransfer) domain-containing protein
MANIEANSRKEPLGQPQPDELLDLRYLAEAAEGDVTFIESILHDYLKGTDQQLEELRGALLAQDRDAVRRLAHSVKGASASVGALKVMELAAELEEQVQESGMARADELVFMVMSEFRRLEAYLARQGEMLIAASGRLALPA